MNRGLIVTLSIFAMFLGLMIYAMQRDPNVLTSTLVGKAAPEFSAEIAQGGQFKSSFGKGRWVMINFWNTTCVVCRVEAPELDRFYREVSLASEKNPLFVSVNIQDSNAQILNFAKDFKLSFPMVADSSGKISLNYGVTGTPETFFVDPNGIVRHRVAGEIDGDLALRFIDWLEKNPGVSSQDALGGFAQVRAAGRG